MAKTNFPCPVCKRLKLVPSELPNSPASHVCAGCGGRWIELAAYFDWLNSPGAASSAAPSETVGLSVADNVKAKLCPGCGHFLRRAKVGHGLGFQIDHCGACGGFWLDRNEWDLLRAAELHDDLHRVFSDAWQARVARSEREGRREQLLVEALGHADVDEAHRVRRWLESHPRRAELYALLLQNYTSPPARPESAARWAREVH